MIDEHPPSDEYLAPSWSWASVRGKRETSWDLGADKRLASCRGIDIQLKNKRHPFGAVKGGSITLYGPFLELEVKDLFDPPLPSSPHREVYEELAGMPEGQRREYQQKHRFFPGQMFALLLSNIHNGMYKFFFVSCLVLESVEGSDSWRRVGLIHVEDTYTEKRYHKLHTGISRGSFLGTTIKSRKVTII